MTMEFYILHHGEPVAADSMTWAVWKENRGGRIEDTTIGNFWISTVFVGIGGYLPSMFETCIFDRGTPTVYKLGDTYRESCWSDIASRTDSLVQAVMGHDLAVAACIHMMADRTKRRKARARP